MAKLKRVPSQSDWERFYKSRKKRLLKLSEAYIAGTVTRDEWFQSVSDVLYEAHLRAYSLGRRRAGNKEAFTPADSKAARVALRKELKWLRRFRDQLPTLSEARIQHRTVLYVNSLLGTANKGWVSSLPKLTRIWWVMTAKEHCATCPSRAEGSPYTLATLPGVPGDGSTECLGNCKCRLIYRTVTGKLSSGFYHGDYN